MEVFSILSEVEVEGVTTKTAVEFVDDERELRVSMR